MHYFAMQVSDMMI